MSDCNLVGSPASQTLSWVPMAAITYLAHTEGGTSIRALARHLGCHASTVSRQVRALEALRDDHLVDEALRRLGPQIAGQPQAGSCSKERCMTAPLTHPEPTKTLTESRLNREALRVLRRLCEKGAVLAVAAEMDKAVVVRETEAGQNRTAVVDRDIAEALALKSWISCDSPGRISRYAITGAGRTALGRLMAQAENTAQGFEESQAAFLGQPDSGDDEDDAQERRRVRYGITESPLILLSRRRNRDGSRFLPAELVRAGERLREDYEMARLNETPRAAWPEILTGAAQPAVVAEQNGSARAAQARVLGALRDLGPGLADVALRCCCFLEGLETTEKKLGWSARSGKIVLRIALQRLKRHYTELGDSAGLMG
ncbi:hypothetical protein XM53_00555 [Roseovarius atlanticus]|uniref:DUF6456 domain-containing protein n=1 Tax=Roseovarius atlanticus TaxID=1641875 RepID=A0A0T5NZH6_9RHOB|nr:DUF6456 domain-containing protein [Roseovarius atlanticus]KRS14264.1 hypothetical protein XM53_00555 [Roseovarius atlanticus]